MLTNIKYGIYISNFGKGKSAKLLTKWAKEAEVAGWDGFFIWDHIHANTRDEIVDPWITLASIAVETEHIKIGTMVTPVARRRPWKLARETTTLDRLSNGRFIMGVGLGEPPDKEFEAFGEDPDPKVRAEKLDEGLDILNGLWSGKSFTYEGKHYQINSVTFKPKPVQSPRIPIWVGGYWPNKAPFIRAAKYDGVFPLEIKTLSDLEDLVDFINQHRVNKENYDIIGMGRVASTPEANKKELLPWYEKGMTWFLEFIATSTPHDKVLERVRRSPPRF